MSEKITHVCQMHASTYDTLRADMARLLAGLAPEAAAEVAIEGMVRYALSCGIGTPAAWVQYLPDADEVEGALLIDETWRADDGNAEIETNASDAQGAAEEYVSDGDWGNDGGSVSVRAWQDAIGQDGADVAVNEEWITVDLPQDEEALIKDAGGDTDCQHEWTSEGEGGLRENPGVWSVGGTAMVFHAHCRLCGLKKIEHHTGSQRNPGEGDTVRFEQPDSWCADCQSEECECE